MGMKELPCKICGSVMQVSSEAKSGVCFSCISTGRFSVKKDEKVAVLVGAEVAQVKTIVETVLPMPVKEKPVDTKKDLEIPIKQKRGERSSRMVGMVKEGKTNKEIMGVLTVEFPLVDSKDLRNLLYVVRNRLGRTK